MLYTSDVCGRAFSWVTLTVPGDVVSTLAESLRLDTRGKQTVSKNCRASLGTAAILSALSPLGVGL